MKKPRRGLNRYNLLLDEKRGKQFLYICIKHKKLNVKKKLKKKRQQQKTVLSGFEPTSTKIDSFYIYSKNQRSTYCAIESFEYYT